MARITEVIVYVENLDDEFIQFYQRVIGQAPIELSDTKASFIVGTSQLTFIEFPHKVSPVHFAFSVQDLQASFDAHQNWLSFYTDEEGDPVVEFVEWRCDSLYFKDPIGNILEFTKKKEIKTKSEESNYISIGEVGFITDDVLLNANIIHEKTGLEFFVRSKGGPNFKAIGGDEGMIILNHENRSWFPYDDMNVGVTHLKIKVEVNGNSFWIEVEEGLVL